MKSGKNETQICYVFLSLGSRLINLYFTHFFEAEDFCNKPKSKKFHQSYLVQNFDDNIPQMYLAIRLVFN